MRVGYVISYYNIYQGGELHVEWECACLQAWRMYVRAASLTLDREYMLFHFHENQ